jgi:hypothetical protein
MPAAQYKGLACQQNNVNTDLFNPSVQQFRLIAGRQPPDGLLLPWNHAPPAHRFSAHVRSIPASFPKTQNSARQIASFGRQFPLKIVSTFLDTCSRSMRFVAFLDILLGGANRSAQISN